MTFTFAVQLDVIAFGRHPLNLVCVQKENASGFLDDESLNVVGFARLKISQECEESFIAIVSSRVADLFTRSLQSLLKTFRIDRLEKVIERVDFKGANRMLVEGGDKHDGRRQI